MKSVNNICLNSGTWKPTIIMERLCSAQESMFHKSLQNSSNERLNELLPFRNNKLQDKVEVSTENDLHIKTTANNELDIMDLHTEKITYETKNDIMDRSNSLRKKEQNALRNIEMSTSIQDMKMYSNKKEILKSTAFTLSESKKRNEDQNYIFVEDLKDEILEKCVANLRSFNCKKCPFMSLNINLMIKHVKEEHSSVAKQSGHNVYHCPGCTNTFYHGISLFSHIVHDHKVHKSEAQIMVQILCKKEEISTGSVNGNEHETYKINCHYPNVEVNAHSENQLTVNTSNIDDHDSSVHTSRTAATDNVHLQKIESQRVTDTWLSNTCNETVNKDNRKTDADFLDKSKPSTTLSFKTGFETISPNGQSRAEKEDSVQAHQEESNTDSVKVSKNDVKQENTKVKITDMKCKKSRALGRHKKADKKNSESKQLGYKCNIENCSIHMFAQENILYHQRCHSTVEDKNIITYQCPECMEFKSSNWNNMAGHLWRSHIVDMELHSCDVCSYKTPSLKILMNQHRAIHGSDRPYLCDNCGKGFKTTKQLRNHRSLHKTKKQLLECGECLRIFTNPRLLKLHKESVHKDSKPYMCNFCAYSASTRSALKLHLRRHTGEKPFTCEQCPYSTGDHNSFRRHKLRHLGLKPYSCPHCSYASIQSSTYKVHLKNKHPGLDHGIMFSCQYCSYRSVKQENLLTHMAKHEQGVPKSEKVKVLTVNSQKM
ncbi:zinc finger protein 658 isoform X2 [Orussus abietinus]|uniref:zinc finger protein 658 isoform X2 n=1 Tax=Orussus abietinus TaxID=222816 RepID=UPI00062597C4|nr:zinc finger protein 658 isoform X2 [Orussus abietinus]